jgi:hypothetical protein
MLQIFDIPATGREINASGKWFQYRKAPINVARQPIRVSADGQDLGHLLPGDAVNLPEPAKRWNVTPVDATDGVQVRIGMASIETPRVEGNVSILDSVGPACQIYVASDLSPGITVAQMIAPTANVNGIIIRQASAEVTNVAGNLALCRLIAAPKLPANHVPQAVPAIVLASVSVNNAASIAAAEQDFNLRRMIPPGWGVFFAKNHGAGGALVASAFISAEVLP